MIIRPVSPPPQPWDIDCSKDPVITKQEFASDCDVNKIIARCVKSGLPLPSVTAAPLYADVSEVGSYADCLRRVSAAEDAFMQLPASLRTEFNNDASQLISFLADPANVDRAVELGLLVKPKVDPVTDPAVPAASAASAASAAPAALAP